jgi:adenylate cyclase
LTGEHAERRLAAIVAADVAGYSRLMGADEEGTLARLKAVRKSLVDPAITAHRGRTVKTTGDGMLVEFASAVDAARCAVEVQHAMAEQNAVVPQDQRIEFRIGIHVGDIIIDENDIFGDGVNIAARLEGIAEPGGVCISDDAQRQIRGKVDIGFDDMGQQNLKNITEPMRVWRLRLAATPYAKAPPTPSVETVQPLPLPEKPSIAVLPFQNMSGDPEQEYLADGMVEDIITRLCQIRWLFVIARNSTFAYKGRAVDVKQVSRELGVRYVLEGSVRKAGSRLRITAQLVDATTGRHHWAQRFDRELLDIFDLQDEITHKVAAAIEPHLLSAEGIRSLNRSPDDLDAWGMVARALTYFWRTTRADNDQAIDILDKAAERYPDYASAQSLLAFALVFAVHMGWRDGPRDLLKARRHAARAAQLDDKDPWVDLALGYLAMMDRRTDDSIAACRRALDLSPSSATALGFLGRVLSWAGRDQEAISKLEEAMRLSPHDPQNAIFLANIGLCHFLAGRFAQAINFLSQATKERPSYLGLQRLLCASLAQAGRLARTERPLSNSRTVGAVSRGYEKGRADIVAKTACRCKICLSDVSKWHETDMLTALRNVRSLGQSGKHMLAMSFSGFDPRRTSRC